MLVLPITPRLEQRLVLGDAALPPHEPRQTGGAKGREGDSAGSFDLHLPTWGVGSPGQRERKGQRGPALFRRLILEEGSCAILPLVMTRGGLRSPGAYVALLSLPTASPAHGVTSVPKTETAFWAHPLGFAWLALEALRIGASTPGVESPLLRAAFLSPASAPGWLLLTIFLQVTTGGQRTLPLSAPMAPQRSQDKPREHRPAGPASAILSPFLCTPDLT